MMTVLREALVTPRGIVMPRPLRLMVSPFRVGQVALQRTQPWVGRPDLLSPAQLRRTKLLAETAKALRGTFGVGVNPKTGLPIPMIALKVGELIPEKLTPAERIRRKRAAAKAYREKLHERPAYQRWVELVKPISVPTVTVA